MEAIICSILVGLAGAFAHLSTALLLGGGVEEENLIRANKCVYIADMGSIPFCQFQFHSIPFGQF